MADSQQSARESVADFWDEVLADWLAGRRDLRPPLDRWFTSYQGKSNGAVDLSHYPDPYVGDLRGLRREPHLVVLGLNPGIGYDELQAPHGVWAQRIRDESYSRCLHRSPGHDPETWIHVHGKPSTYWANLARFARRWLEDEAAGVDDILNFELYPWHSPKIQGVMKPPADILDRFVWQPTAELAVSEVFAFGAAWFEICDALGLPKLAIYGAGQPFPGYADLRNWRLGIYQLPSDQLAVVSSQSGFAGPPGVKRLEIMRELVTQARQLTQNPGAQHDPNIGIPWEVVEGLEAHSVKRKLRLLVAHPGPGACDHGRPGTRAVRRSEARVARCDLGVCPH